MIDLSGTGLPRLSQVKFEWRHTADGEEIPGPHIDDEVLSAVAGPSDQRHLPQGIGRGIAVASATMGFRIRRLAARVGRIVGRQKRRLLRERLTRS